MTGLLYHQIPGKKILETFLAELTITSFSSHVAEKPWTRFKFLAPDTWRKVLWFHFLYFPIKSPFALLLSKWFRIPRQGASLTSSTRYNNWDPALAWKGLFGIESSIYHRIGNFMQEQKFWFSDRRVQMFQVPGYISALESSGMNCWCLCIHLRVNQLVTTNYRIPGKVQG